MRRAPIAASLVSGLVLSLILGDARQALAAGDDVATAQVLFEDARKLMASGRWSEACPKLEDSQRLAPGIGTEFNLADCFEHQGRLASAWVAFVDVIDRTHKRGEAQRELAARTRADALVARLGKLTITVPTALAGLEVRRDGQVVRPEVWGLAMPVDAGDHRIEARAHGRVPWRAVVHTADGAPAQISVPELGVAAESSSVPDEDPTTDAPPVILSPLQRDHTAAAIVLGASVVLAGVGVLGLVEHSSNVASYNADSSCPPIDAASRPAQCSDYVNAASTWNTVGIVGLVGSGAALIGGVTLWVLSPSRPLTAAGRLTCAPGLAAVTCGGAF